MRGALMADRIEWNRKIAESVRRAWADPEKRRRIVAGLHRVPAKTRIYAKKSYSKMGGYSFLGRSWKGSSRTLPVKVGAFRENDLSKVEDCSVLHPGPVVLQDAAPEGEFP